ncbi:MAG: helix-turn-helix domain-containing protein [Acidobacteriota bacterium]
MSDRNNKDVKGRTEYLTAGQLAKLLQISESSVHRLRRQGRIPAVMLTPRLIRFNLRDVRTALAEQEESVAPRISVRTAGEQLAFEDLFTETIE